MNTILEMYNYHCNTPSDINENLYLLKEVAEQCEHVTEFGVRTVVSTWALLAAYPKKLISYDILYHENIEKAKKLSAIENINFSYFIQDVIKQDFSIEETDFLFIDTKHTYKQLKHELAQHASKVRKFIGFHDIVTFGLVNEFNEKSEPAGLMSAITEFLETNKAWSIEHVKYNNNGMMILKKNYE